MHRTTNQKIPPGQALAVILAASVTVWLLIGLIAFAIFSMWHHG